MAQDLVIPIVGVRLPFRFFDTREQTGTGTVTLDFGSPAIEWQWRIERIYVDGAGTVKAYSAGLEFDLSSSGNNIADEAQPISVFGGSTFRIVFTGVPAGTLCKANIQGLCLPV